MFHPRAHANTAHTVTTSDGVKLHVFDSARVSVPSAQILLFVPGWSMPGVVFDKQVAAFSPHFRVLVLDPRGQGASEIAQDGYTLERRSQDIADVLTTLNLQNVVLVGWSLGVLESLHLSTTPAAARIAAYVLVDNSVGEATPPKGDPNFFSNLRGKRDETVQRFVNGMFKTPQLPQYTGHIAQLAQQMSVENSIALLSYPKPRTYWRDALYAIEKPTAYFVTQKFFAQADAVKEKRPATFVKKFPSAGHALFVDAADEFNDSIRAFVSTLK